MKAETRTRRGKVIRRRVEPSNSIPGSWQEFLRINDNKTELFSFLATSAATIATDKQVISTCHTGVLCTQSRDVSGLAPCTHEEADTRILLHLEDALKHGYNTVSLRIVDTDVVVHQLSGSTSPNCGLPLVLERTFAIYRPTRWPTHWVLIVVLLCQCFMHSLVCHGVSCFGDRGKRTAWDIWNAYDEVTPAFCALAATPESVENWLGPLERFVVLLYDRTSSQEFVNGATKQLFTQKGRAIEGLPPTQAALLQHTKRAAYQAGHCWAQTMIATPELPSPS